MIPRSRPAELLCTLLIAASTCFTAPAHAQPKVQWAELGPPARFDGAMVWDSRRGRALLFGGDGAFGYPYTGVWQFLRTPRPHWEPLGTTPDGPPLRSGMSAVYDSVGDRVLLFGGRGTYGDLGTNELWQLRLNEPVRWLQLQYAPGPIPTERYDASMILTRDRRLVLFGGDGAGGSDGAVWILPLDAPSLAWQKPDEYTLGPGPGPRTRHGAAYSPTTDRMLVFGGEQRVFEPLLGTVGYSACASNTWALSLTAPIHWVSALVNPGGPHPLREVGGPLVPDITGRYAWLIPGISGENYDSYGDTDWRYDFEARAWSKGHPGFGGPGRLVGVASCLDRATGDLLVHSGTHSLIVGFGEHPYPETWALTIATVPGWVGLCRVPGISDGSWGPRAHFDSQTRRLVTWTREGVWTCDVATDATWQLQPVSAGDGPQFDYSMSTIDPVRRRLLVFGGWEFTGGSYIEHDVDRLWSWPLDGSGSWSVSPIAGRLPTGITGTQCAFDAVRDRIIVLPSLRSTNAPLDTLPVIELSGDPRWVQMPVAGNAPAPRTDGTLIVDPVHDRLILQGGVCETSGDGAYAPDLWSLYLGGTPRWHLEISTPIDGARCGLAVDPTLGRILVVGGTGLTPFSIGERREIQSTQFDDPDTWENLDPTGQSPMLGGGPLSFDAASNRMVWWNGRQLWQITWPLGTPAPYGPAVVNAGPTSVSIRWPGQPTEPYAAAVDRSMDGGRTWLRLRSVAPEYDGSLAFTDSSLAPGLEAAYRATIERNGTTHVLGTASTVLGTATPVALTLATPRPNPARDDVVLELGAPVGGTITLELYDIAGRLAAPAMRRTMPAGTIVFTAPLARGLAPGLYMLRASDGRQSVHARLVVVR